MVYEVLEIIRRLYYNANLRARQALLMTIIVPIAFIVTALFAGLVLPDRVSMFILPLVALLPAVGAFLWLFAVIDPVVVAVIKSHDEGDRAVRIVFGIFAVELAIGAYFSIVPIASWPRFVPFMILLIALMVSLAFSPKAPFFVKAMKFSRLALAILTLTFFLGGLFPEVSAWLPGKIRQLEHEAVHGTPSTIKIANVKDGWQRFDPPMEKSIRLRPQGDSVLFKASKGQAEPYILDEDGEFWVGQGAEKRQVSREELSGMQAFWMKSINPGQTVPVNWEEVPYRP